ncbi:MAG: hydantoinase/oxoprolinase family protein [Deltaproteobacteria bacterium]|nr:hydantoinase/oxoprolinase family protein [Deltaproteobacteria bacterium]
MTQRKTISTTPKYQLGIDIGGTFIDLVLLDPDSGRIAVGKKLSTGSDPVRAVIEGMEEMLERENIGAQQVNKAIHGTTLITNLIIERKGAKTGLLTTKGFRDALEIGREMRYDIYDIFLELPRPLSRRRHRLEVTERLDNHGNVLIPLTRKEAERVVDELLDLGIESAAICLLHSFRNPAHEEMLRNLILAKRPRFPVSISSEVVPEVGEYERVSTTVANAYTMPVARRYLKDLDRGMKELGLGGRLYIMLSTGGITTPHTAADHPIRLLESGPAAGVLAAAWIGRQTQEPDVISFDMGGTTAKTCLIENGHPVRVNEFEAGRVYRFKKGSGLPIKIPVIEMIEIGAGGGSIASIGPMGLLKVGPESAGAEPGPACYARGGRAPTVTDADLILGYLDADFFLGGEIQLDLSLARSAFEERLAKPLDLTIEQAAWGVHEVVNENMANAARIHAVEKGLDPRRFALVAFGGAGPVHAYEVARKLKLNKIIVPPAAGVCSAFGFLLAPMSFDLSRSYVTRLDAIKWDRLNAIYEEMETTGYSLLLDAGVAPEQIRFMRWADMRYVGQGFEVQVSLPGGKFSAESVEAFRKTFEHNYKNIYQRLCEEIPIEGVNWRVVATGPSPEIDAIKWWRSADTGSNPQKATRKAYLPGLSDYTEVPVYDRYAMPAGYAIEGPAIIEERESTLVINGPGMASVDAFGNIIVQVR